MWMMQRFPASLGEVDELWLTDAFRTAGLLALEHEVTQFEVVPIGSGFGQTGDSVRLRLTYSGPSRAPATTFAKFATQDPVRRQASQSLGLYRREVDFYTTFARQAQVRAPACYFAAASREGDYATLLLEDFPDHRPGDDLVGLKPDEAEAAVDLLANLHGPFWGRGHDLGIPPLIMGTRERFVVAWAQMEQNFGNQLSEKVRSVREPFLDAIAPLHDWLVSGPTTLGHGDLKLDNLLFGPPGKDRIVAVDWQAIRPQKGMRDIAYLLSHSMDVAHRREYEQALLARYAGRLAGFGIDYPAKQAIEDYRLSMLFDFCTVLYIVGVNLNTNERALRRKRALMERAVTALLDWDAFSLLDRFR